MPLPDTRPSLTTQVLVRPHPSSRDTFVSQSLWTPFGARGVFGGQVIGQSLLACSHTLPAQLSLHSMHCYFLLPANASIPIEYRVERIRDGRSYANRIVRAYQKSKVVFVLAASFASPPKELHLGPEEGVGAPFSFTPSKALAGSGSGANGGKTPVSHSLRFSVETTTTTAEEEGGRESSTVGPSASWRDKEGAVMPSFTPRFQVPLSSDILPFDQCEEEELRWQRFLDDNGASLGKRRKAIEEYIAERKGSPVGIAVARRRERRDGEDERNRRVIWMRARLHEGEKPDIETVKAMIAYMSDFQFIGTAARSLGLMRTSRPRLGMLATLDHTIHFYPFPAGLDTSRPLLHVMESPMADVGSGRGVVRGLVYTEDGVLLAVTEQEGVVRADLGKQKERGLIEGGGMGEADEDKKGDVKAKL